MPNKTILALDRDLLKKLYWSVMAILALLMFLLASTYLTLNPEVYFEEQKAVYISHTAGITIHIIGAMLAIVIGPLQFLPQSITKKYLKLHRRLGKIYLLGVFCGGLGGLYMAFFAYGGLTARLGFTTLAIVWLFSGYMAYKQIRNRKIQLHRQWMVRNYALTFAGVTLRLWQLVFELLGVEFVRAHIIVAWLSWILNSIVAEWIIRQIRRNTLRSRSEQKSLKKQSL